MPRNVLLACLTLSSIAFLVAAPVVAAGKKKTALKTGASSAAVEKVLRAEVAGEVDRRRQLAETLNQHPDSPLARWIISCPLCWAS